MSCGPAVFLCPGLVGFLYEAGVMAGRRPQREARENRHVRGGGGNRNRPTVDLAKILSEKKDPLVLVLDGVQGGVFGQNALAMALIAYFCLLSYQRWRYFTMLQSSGLVALLVALYQLVTFWFGSLFGRAGDLGPWLTVAAASVVAWLLVNPLLMRLARPVLVERR